MRLVNIYRTKRPGREPRDGREGGVREQWERKCGVWGELACKRRVSLSLSRSLPRLGRDGRVGRCAGLATVSRRALWLAGSSHRKDALAAAGEADAARVAPSHDGGRGAARRAGRPCRRPWPPGPSRAGRSSRRHRAWGGLTRPCPFCDASSWSLCVCVSRRLARRRPGWVGAFCQPGRSSVPVPRQLSRPRPRLGALLLLRACRKLARLARPALILSQLAKAPSEGVSSSSTSAR